MEDESMGQTFLTVLLPTSSYIIIMRWPDVSTTGAQAIGDLCQELTKGVIWNIGQCDSCFKGCVWMAFKGDPREIKQQLPSASLTQIAGVFLLLPVQCRRGAERPLRCCE